MGDANDQHFDRNTDLDSLRPTLADQRLRRGQINRETVLREESHAKTRELTERCLSAHSGLP